MDLKELKKTISLAKKLGVRVLKVNGIEIEFQNEIVYTPTKTRKKLEAVPDAPTKADEKIPTLDEINKWIYEQTDEAM